MNPADPRNMPPVLVLAAGRDGALSCRVLQEAGHDCHRCADAQELLLRLAGEVSAVLLAQEALDAALLAQLERLVAAQPAWSDLPFIVVALRSHQALLQSLEGLGNLAVLTRPVAPASLASAVGVAIRARRRQLQVRDLLHDEREQAVRKDEFLAMLAHELRNPLTPIRYAAHMLLSAELDGERRAAVGRVVEHQAAHMGRLVERLLDATRVSRGLIELQVEQTDLAGVVGESVDAHSAAAHDRDVDVRIDASEHAWVAGDPTRLRQVCDDLLDNAIKFSSPGDTVRVELRQDELDALLRVIDEGDGIDPGDLSRIFEPFMQGDRTLDRARGGLGLGLSMVRGLVALHGGRVEAGSAGRGRGSAFTVRIPLAPQPQACAGGAPEEAQPCGRRRVLLVEDNLDAAETLKMLLELAGHEVTHYPAGDAAVEAARSTDFDAVICDIGLPRMNGYEVAQALRAMPRHAGTLLVAVTGYGGRDSQAAALAAGFDEHCAKPVAPEHLLELLDRGCGEPAQGAAAASPPGQA